MARISKIIDQVIRFHNQSDQLIPVIILAVVFSLKMVSHLAAMTREPLCSYCLSQSGETSLFCKTRLFWNSKTVLYGLFSLTLSILFYRCQFLANARIYFENYSHYIGQLLTAVCAKILAQEIFSTQLLEIILIVLSFGRDNIVTN